MAERVIVVDHGRIIADDSPARLKAKHVGDRITLGFATSPDAAAAADRMPHQVSLLEQRTLRISVDGAPGLLPGILEDLRAAGLGVTSIEVTRPTLDDVFLQLTGRSLREGGAAPESAVDRELVEV
ncbi:DUF4162 domain-containing protein [Actinoplanes sp. NPDC051470]|uniref:ATP-binding protein DrrA1-3 family domain-containing protein n=1 Tax=Actinoplanes sp. NPDC051470 TaxID=3157224 RepID=UPI003430586A